MNRKLTGQDWLECGLIGGIFFLIAAVCKMNPQLLEAAKKNLPEK
jgi:hypothetical protein